MKKSLFEEGLKEILGISCVEMCSVCGEHMKDTDKNHKCKKCDV